MTIIVFIDFLKIEKKNNEMLSKVSHLVSLNFPNSLMKSEIYGLSYKNFY